ncbi:MAG: M20 family metallo-hydrolase [Bacteroidetes bacterium]|nr:M20 family metallo-hydrolase [Bacteroidota bacterium]
MAHVSVSDIAAEMIILLQRLIAIPSFSREETATADLLQSCLSGRGILSQRKGNNVWARNKLFSAGKKTLLLNSHHDTVKPNKGYTRDPFSAQIIDDRLYGLGSNDAGGSLVSLLGVFLHYYDRADLPFNIIYAATAEEEISGTGGVESIIEHLIPIDLVIVGEPTLMQMAVAERGLLVLDCTAHGIAGHAARREGVNAIYKAIQDIDWFRTYQFDKVSPWLGEVSMNVTTINAGSAHNQVPPLCTFTVDIRLNDCYTHAEVLELIRNHVSCDIRERSTRIKASFIPVDHPMPEVARQLGIKLYGSPTTSDMALMPWPSIKMGPGHSARSHSADEYILIQEINEGVSGYITLLDQYFSKA